MNGQPRHDASDGPLPLTQTIEPADEAAVAAAVREAFASKTPIYPIGGGTRLDYGAAAATAGHRALAGRARTGSSTTRPADMTVTVGAGMTMAKLARTLAAAGQRLPIDMPRSDRATVGGAVAVDAAGPRRYGYGTMRDYVLGLRAVDGRGTVFSAGCRVLEKRRRLQPLPPPDRLAGHAGRRDAGDAHGSPCAGGFGPGGLRPPRPGRRRAAAGRRWSVRRRCPWPSSCARGRPVVPAPRRRRCPRAAPIRLVVGFEGRRAEVEWMVARLCEQWRHAGVSSLTTVTDGDAESWWNWLTDFPADFQVGVLPGVMVETMARLGALLPDCSMQAHAGNGVVRVQWPPRAARRQGAGHAAARHAAAGRRGTRRHARRPLDRRRRPAATKLGREDVWGPPGDAAAMAVMRALKERFDPAGVLNPGRFIY